MAVSNIQHFEYEYILDRTLECPVCDTKFKAKSMKSNKARRIGADADLRPRFADVDSLKYLACVCPKCGYASLITTCGHLGSLQIKNLRARAKENFDPFDFSTLETYSYSNAVYILKHALFCCDLKFAKDGEKAYLNLVLAWIYREVLSIFENEGVNEIPEMSKEKLQAAYDEHYLAAFDGFQNALMNERPPIVGMDQTTIEYLLAYMAYHFKKIDVAAKLVSNVITSSNATRNVKEKARDLKDEIIDFIKNGRK